MRTAIINPLPLTSADVDVDDDDASKEWSRVSGCRYERYETIIRRPGRQAGSQAVKHKTSHRDHQFRSSTRPGVTIGNNFILLPLIRLKNG